MAGMGTSKVYILDKYFNELQKFWDTEKRLQGNSQSFLERQYNIIKYLILSGKANYWVSMIV